MRIFLALAATAALAAGQSHPAWWTWASPDATALVGVRWEALQGSAFADALDEELGPEGSLGLPDLDCLRHSKQLLLSSPAFLIIASGDFPADRLRAQAAAQSMKPTGYKGVDLWISPGKSTLSVARVGDHVLLVGLRRALEAAIDRNQPDSERRYSPLLQRAARFAGPSANGTENDLWVVATQLPDPLASHFVPLDVDARGIEGSVTLSDGIRLEATLSAGSLEDARTLAGRLRQEMNALPSIARGLQVVQAGDMVVLAMAASREQVSASLRGAEPQPTAVAVSAASPPPLPLAPPVTKVQVAAKVAQPSAPIAASPLTPVPVASVPVASAPVTTVPVSALSGPAPTSTAVASVPAVSVPVAHAPTGTRVIRIIGLDDGPREIVLPPLNR